MSTNDDFPWGERIRSERERLGLTQDAIAGKLGVSRATQINYESNKRCPDGEYLRALGGVGADVGYVLFGERSTANNLYSLAVRNVLPRITDRARINLDALLGILDLAAEAEAIHWRGQDETPLPDIDKKIVGLVNALFERGDLLGKIFIEVVYALHDAKASKASVGPNKRAELVLMLYDAFKGRGRVDRKIARIAVRAALA